MLNSNSELCTPQIELVALVDSINTVQNEIEKRSEASKKKLMQNLNGMGKKSFFQSRFS